MNETKSADIAHAETARMIPSTEIYDESWLTSLLRPVLVVVLVGCVSVVFITTLGRVAEDLSRQFLGALLALALLAAILGVTTTTVLSLPSNRIKRSAGLRAAELLVLLALTRVFVWALGTGFPTANSMLTQPLSHLLDPLFMGSGLIVGVSWILAVDFTDNLASLGLQGDELYRARTGQDRDADSMRGSAANRQSLLSQILFRWVGIGILLIILSALLRTDMASNTGGVQGFIGIARQNIEPQVMAAIVLYFLIGLFLISQGRLSMLRARWSLDRLSMSEDVTRRWSPFLLGLLAIIGVVALFLPLGGTFLLASILSAVIGGIITALFTFYQFLIFAFFWLISLVLGEPPPPVPEVAPTPVPMEQIPPPVAQEALLPAWLSGGAFWIIVAALVIYAATLYFRDKGVRFGWLLWLWNKIRGGWQEVTSMFHLRGRRLDGEGGLGSKGGRSLPEWLRRKPNDPDALVRYYYFATLEEAQEAGVGRQQSETPLVYADRLEGRLEAPPVSADALPGESSAPPAVDDQANAEAALAVQELTDAFVAQRYAGVSANQSLAEQLQERWKALHGALNKRKRS